MPKETKTVLMFAGVFLVMAMVAGYVVNGTMTEVSDKERAIDELRVQLKAAEDEAAEYDELRGQLDSLQVNLAHYVRILPSPEVATEERLLELIQERCERAQFNLASITIVRPRAAPAARGRGRPAPAAARATGFQEVGVTLNAQGTYEQFLRFLNSLERHESFLRVNSFACTAPATPARDEDGNEVWALQIAMNISTFRYAGAR